MTAIILDLMPKIEAKKIAEQQRKEENERMLQEEKDRLEAQNIIQQFLDQYHGKDKYVVDCTNIDYSFDYTMDDSIIYIDLSDTDEK